MTDIFQFIISELGDSYWPGVGGAPGDGLADMYFGQVDEQSQKLLPEAFKKQDSLVRCLISTVAFGLGVQINDGENVLHWGVPDNILQYWQEVGRAGRDGRKSQAILYLPPWSVSKRRVEESFIDLISNSGNMCVRRQVLTYLKVGNITESDIGNCCGGNRCCNFWSS